MDPFFHRHRGFTRFRELTILEQILREFTQGRIPPGIKYIMGFCTLVYILQPAFDIHLVTFRPDRILQGQVYRMFTSPLLHGDPTHLLYNMASVLSFERQIERQLGTLRHLECVFWAILLSKSIYIAVALFYAHILDNDRFMRTSVVGYSGVLFYMAVTECKLFAHMDRQMHVPFLGEIRVPAAWYPWALLALGELWNPQSSFLGHLSGILAGLVQMSGVLDGLLLSRQTIQQLELWSGPLLRDPHFVESRAFLGPRDNNLRRSMDQTIKDINDIVNLRLVVLAVVLSQTGISFRSVGLVVILDVAIAQLGKYSGLFFEEPILVGILNAIGGGQAKIHPSSQHTDDWLYDEVGKMEGISSKHSVSSVVPVTETPNADKLNESEVSESTETTEDSDLQDDSEATEECEPTKKPAIVVETVFEDQTSDEEETTNAGEDEEQKREPSVEVLRALQVFFDPNGKEDSKAIIYTSQTIMLLISNATTKGQQGDGDKYRRVRLDNKRVQRCNVSGAFDLMIALGFQVKQDFNGDKFFFYPLQETPAWLATVLESMATKCQALSKGRDVSARERARSAALRRQKSFKNKQSESKAKRSEGRYFVNGLGGGNSDAIFYHGGT